jgi:uncharacterized membrane protein YdjX (TVP38/TMEM64 family)
MARRKMTVGSGMDKVGIGREPAVRRWLPLLALAAGVTAFFALGLDRYLGYAALVENHHRLAAEVARLGPVALVAYVALYVVVAALSVPGAAVLTVAGGFFFGWVEGGFAALLGATGGATLIFLVARTSLGDPLLRRAGPFLRRLEVGFRANAASYLLVLRLVPLFPFWLVNLVPAFLGVPLWVFVLYSFIGMLPGTFVYAGLGQGLSEVIESGQKPDLGILFEAHVLGPLVGLAVLALLPVAYKWYRSRRPGRRG